MYRQTTGCMDQVCVIILLIQLTCHLLEDYYMLYFIHVFAKVFNSLILHISHKYYIICGSIRMLS